MNINFLNNQNYILGKAEKKKLLSKFFVEKLGKKVKNGIKIKFLDFIMFFSKKNIFIHFLLFPISGAFIKEKKSEKKYLGIIIFFTFISYLGSLLGGILIFNGFLKDFYFYYGIVLLIFSYLLISLQIDGYYFRKNTFKSFLIYEKNLFNNENVPKIIFLFLPLLFFISFLLSSTILGVNNGNGFTGLGMFIMLILGYPIGYLLLKLKIFNIIFFPLNILFYIIYYLFIRIPFLHILSVPFIFIYIFFIKGTKGFLFLKFKNNSKFLKKFKKLEKNYAESEYYRLEIKK